MNGFTLRDYQEECLQSILDRYREGIRRQLICLPTGTGKTVIFASFPKQFQMKKQMLVLAHREELLEQARAKVLLANPHLQVDIEQASRHASPDCDVLVGSVQTLGRKNSKRLARLNPENFYLIVVDEAHHAPADSYLRILTYFEVLKAKTRKLLVGFTATPKRGDGLGLDKIFQEITYAKTLPEMIEAGYLSPIAGYRIESEVDLSSVRTRMGDFVVSDLSQRVNIKERNDLIVAVYKERLEGKKTLCFCVDVEHAYTLAETFAQTGIAAAAVSGDMQRDKRKEVLADFHHGNVQVLANCMVLTEGYDEPSVEGIILARPTKSALLYTQMIGRGTRLYPGKEEVMVVDIVDVTRKHNLTTLPSLFGLNETFDMEGRTVEEVKKAIEWVEENRPYVAAHKAESLTDLRYRCRRIDMLDMNTPLELEAFSRFAWFSLNPGAYRLGLADSRSLSVESTILGKWEIVLHNRGAASLVTTENTLRTAIMKAEKYVVKHFPDEVRLVMRESFWRHQPASPKQIDFLRRKQIDVPPELTKGHASHIISMLRGN